MGLTSSVQVRRCQGHSESTLPLSKLVWVATCAQCYLVASGPDRFDHPMGDTTNSNKSPTHYIDEGTKNQRIVRTVQIVYAKNKLGRNTLSGTFDSFLEYSVLKILQ